jgi:hypothetical protein
MLAGRRLSTGGMAVNSKMEQVTPLEAFQYLLRGSHPANPALADQITSIDWFYEMQLSPPIEGTTAAARQQMP